MRREGAGHSGSGSSCCLVAVPSPAQSRPNTFGAFEGFGRNIRGPRQDPAQVRVRRPPTQTIRGPSCRGMVLTPGVGVGVRGSLLSCWCPTLGERAPQPPPPALQGHLPPSSGLPLSRPRRQRPAGSARRLPAAWWVRIPRGAVVAGAPGREELPLGAAPGAGAGRGGSEVISALGRQRLESPRGRIESDRRRGRGAADQLRVSAGGGVSPRAGSSGPGLPGPPRPGRGAASRRAAARRGPVVQGAGSGFSGGWVAAAASGRGVGGWRPLDPWTLSRETCLLVLALGCRFRRPTRFGVQVPPGRGLKFHSLECAAGG